MMWKNVRAAKPMWQALRKSRESQILVRDFGFIVYIDN